MKLLHVGVAALPLLVAFGAVAQEVRLDAGFRPHLTTEVDVGLHGVSTTSASDRARGGTSLFLYGEIAAGLHLAPNVSIQGVLAFEPIGEGDALGGFPDGGTTGFRRQSAFIEAFYAEWKPDEDVTLQAGRFVAPFTRGHHDFPGILTRIRAHEVSAITDSLGAVAKWTFLSDLTWGEHDVSAAVFTLDRSFLSSTLATRRACCDERYERFNSNTRQRGGPANTGRLDNASLALDGDGFAWLPGFSYHLAALTRGAGVDGRAREWGYAAALAWQRDRRKRSVEPLPTENHVEASVGGDIAENVSLDVGYQYGRYAREEAGGLGTSHAVLFRLGWRGF